MKRVCKVLLSVLFVLTALFACVGCTTKDKVECAPCTVGEIWRFNDTLNEEFFPFRRMPQRELQATIKCTVDGEELTLDSIDWHEKELSEGKHEIVFYAVEGAEVYKPVKSMDGRVSRELVEYEPKVVVKVNVSSDYADVYDEEYREAHGLWVNASDSEWYEDCFKEWIKGDYPEGVISDEDAAGTWLENFFEKLFG